MECEPLSSSDHYHNKPHDDIATTSTAAVPNEDRNNLPFEALTYIRLRDVMPCNLRSTHDFLQSSVKLAIET